MCENGCIWIFRFIFNIFLLLFLYLSLLLLLFMSDHVLHDRSKGAQVERKRGFEGVNVICFS